MWRGKQFGTQKLKSYLSGTVVATGVPSSCHLIGIVITSSAIQAGYK